MYSVEELDHAKTKILKYILYKKRTEQEIRNKFKAILSEELLEDAIEYLKEAGYIQDEEYIDRAVREFMALRTLSLKEIKYKLLTKGIKQVLIEEYFEEQGEVLKEYEIQSAKKIVSKKESGMQSNELRFYLLKKGYREDAIKQALGEK